MRVKSFLKEDFTPAHVRKVYFWLAPAIVMIPSLLTIAVIPFGSNIGGAEDGDRGSERGNSLHVRHRFAGRLRNRAGGLRRQFEVSVPRRHPLQRADDFVRDRDGHVGHSDLPAGGQLEPEPGHCSTRRSGLFSWLIFKQPLAFVIFLVAAFAETNRLPFDLPESEQELAGGYNVEYSSMKFALFFMGEYANMIAASAMMVTLFLGGWTLPFAGWINRRPTLGMGWRTSAFSWPRCCVVDVHDHLGALDVAAFPLRSTDGFGLAPVHSAGAGEYCGHGALLWLLALEWQHDC